MITTNPEKFATWFNETYPGAHRRVSIEDITDMTAIGLIERYGYYSTSEDGETIRRILRYEELRNTRFAKIIRGEEPKAPRCRMCGEPLPLEPEGKVGRPKEYCPSCEELRNADRQYWFRRRRHRDKRWTATG
ncbi:hypothetical protein ACFLWB_02775 [Chloroflexota bacterium]